MRALNKYQPHSLSANCSGYSSYSGAAQGLLKDGSGCLNSSGELGELRVSLG